MCVRGIDYSIEFRNCSDTVVFFFHFIMYCCILELSPQMTIVLHPQDVYVTMRTALIRLYLCLRTGSSLHVKYNCSCSPLCFYLCYVTVYVYVYVCMHNYIYVALLFVESGVKHQKSINQSIIFVLFIYIFVLRYLTT